MAFIGQANKIISEYLEQGLTLTVRQLYYQFVARDFIPNTERNYKNLANIIKDARICGFIDWKAIEDRMRNLRKLDTWDSPSEIIQDAIYAYRIDKWKNQEYRIEIWTEKDALLGVIMDVCDSLEVPYFSCRGYNSQSEMWRAGQRILRYKDEGKKAIILHFGDHDPSGIDMTRDIETRLITFWASSFDDTLQINRIALNIDQVRKYGPPPNPAKVTDSRFSSYVSKHGNQSWELDALEPTVLIDLIETSISSYIDKKQWELAITKERQERIKLQEIVNKLDK